MIGNVVSPVFRVLPCIQNAGGRGGSTLQGLLTGVVCVVCVWGEPPLTKGGGTQRLYCVWRWWVGAGQYPVVVCVVWLWGEPPLTKGGGTQWLWCVWVCGPMGNARPIVWIWGAWQLWLAFRFACSIVGSRLVVCGGSGSCSVAVVDDCNDCPGAGAGPEGGWEKTWGWVLHCVGMFGNGWSLGGCLSVGGSHTVVGVGVVLQWFGGDVPPCSVGEVPVGGVVELLWQVGGEWGSSIVWLGSSW